MPEAAAAQVPGLLEIDQRGPSLHPIGGVRRYRNIWTDVLATISWSAASSRSQAPTRCYFSGSRWSSRQAQRLVSTKSRTFSRPVSGLVLRCLRLGPGARATRRGSSASRHGKQCRRPPHPAHPEPRSADVCCRHNASGSRGFPQTRDTCSTDFGPREKCGLALAFEQFHAKAHLFRGDLRHIRPVARRFAGSVSV